MARPSDADNVKSRQRSNTATFPSFTWRRPRPETVSPSTQPPSLSFDALLEALTPPAVPSLVHARALSSAIASQSPLPRPAVLSPLLASLCGPDSPPSLQCAGYEIMTAFWDRYDDRVSTSDKLTFFSLVLHSSWCTEVGEPRLKALLALTKGGKDVLGIEILLLNVLKSWIEGAFDIYISCAPSDRPDRERTLDLLTSYMSSVLGDPGTSARVSEGDLASVLQFYATLAGRALDLSPSTLTTSESTFLSDPQPSSAKSVPPNGHRRHPSSLSLRSPPAQPALPAARHPAEFMVTIYLDHLVSQLKSLSPRTLTLILPLLFRAQAFFASPLPRLSITSGRSLGPAGLEERIQKTLHSLLAGPYGTSCMMILKRQLSPPAPDTLPKRLVPQLAQDQDALNSVWCAISLGAHRTLRNGIRQALCSKMARAYISRLGSTAYSPSGAPAQIDLERDLMERAWSKDDLSGWDLLKLGRMLSKSVEAWAKYAASEQQADMDLAQRDKVLDEAAGTLKDIFQELDEREDRIEWDEEEATIAGETLQHLASFVRPLKNPDDTPFIIPLSQPNGAPTPFLRTLASLLARDHSTYMNPSLSITLLSISEHLTDADTAKLPAIMLEQHDLSPALPAWLANWGTILGNWSIFSPTRPLTRLEVMKALQTIYDSLRDLHSYRIALADLVYKFCVREASGEGCIEDLATGCGRPVMWRILADEVVLRTVTVQHQSPEDQTTPLSTATPSRGSVTTSPSIQDIIALLKRTAAEGSHGDDDDAASLNAGDAQPAALSGGFSVGSSSSAASPMLSRRQSEYRSIPAKDSALPSVMSLLSTLAGSSRSQSQLQSQEYLQVETAIPPAPQQQQQPQFVASPSPIPQEPPLTRASLAVNALVTIFSQLVFTPHSLSQANIDVAFPVFSALVQLVTNGRCARARLMALQFLMRLRADNDHRVYFAEVHHDVDELIAMLASLIGRGPGAAHLAPGHGHHREDERGASHDALDDFAVRRARSTQERDGRRSSHGRGVRPSQSTSSRSRSRARLSASLSAPTISQPKPPRDFLWSVPESLPFTAIDTDIPSEGVVSYDPVSESNRVLKVGTYLVALLGVLESERNWEILSYVLCHLPVQLSNKHFFCGPKSRVLIAKVLAVFCAGVTTGELGSCIDRWPLGMKARDAHGLAYQTMSVLISYRRSFDTPLRHALVDVLREGLNGQPSTIICCLRALTLCAFELTPSLKRTFPPILEKLSQIMSNPAMAVHILNFLSITGSISELHANLREDDFKMIFGVALQYLQHHNRPGATPTISWAMSQHVRMISFYVVYVWFLSVKLSDRHRHIPYITRQLLLANEGREEVDEPTEVCFDWLARYTYASADPRPANSTLSEIVMHPTNHLSKSTSSEPAISEKSWLMGNAIVTIRSLARLGWLEIVSRRPSGFTKFLCRLENVPLVGPGDVDPDMVSLPAAILMEREDTKVDPPDPQGQSSHAGSGGSKEVRETVEGSGNEATAHPPPDPITGYVWSKTAPSQRRKHVTVDPSFFALQLSPYPDPHRSPTTLKRITDESALLVLFRSLDWTPVIDTHKVGIMYVAPGQTQELEILRNTHGSPAYTHFLEDIGRLINLRGQVDVYAGGLNPDEDGEYAYAWWDDIAQILYHTATMMPNAPGDEYCVNKKRHIGNDYVRIVWNDSGRPYRFDTLATQFQFVNIVIEPHSLGVISAFSNFRRSSSDVAAAAVSLPNPAGLPGAAAAAASWNPTTSNSPFPGSTHESENEYFKVTVQRAQGMHDFAPLGSVTLISAERLPILVRQLSLLADRFAGVFERTERDEAEVDVITNWRQRLQVVKRFKKALDGAPGVEEAAAPDSAPGDGVVAQESYRNFTTAY